jgi:nitrogen PTS system EIIA component
MKLAALFDESNIRIHMKASTYEEAVGELIQAVASHLGALNPDRVLERVISVEDGLLVSPAHGVRIPHARLAGLNRLVLALGTSSEGIPSPQEGDDKKVHLIFLILTPKTQSTVMLQTLSSVARLVSVEENRRALVSTTTSSRLQRILEESGIQVKKAIVASDLMNPPTFVVDPEMTLREVTVTLASCAEEGVPVVSESGELLGDISTRQVIEVGLPKYMNLISDPKVLSEFEPFEAFYRKEDTLEAREVMKDEILRLAPETPVEIVAHEMVTQKCERAYIVEEKKLIGVVYRKDIVRKVLNL